MPYNTREDRYQTTDVTDLYQVNEVTQDNRFVQTVYLGTYAACVQYAQDHHWAAGDNFLLVSMLEYKG